MSTAPDQDRLSHKEAEQRERMFDLLPDDLFDAAIQLPYAKRLMVERWFTHEAGRIRPAMARVTEGAHHTMPIVTELLDMLAADPIDLQGAARWLAEHRDAISAQLLAELVSAAMGRGVMDLMSARANIRHDENREKSAEALRLWEEEYKAKPKMSKGKAAPLIAQTVGLAESTVRRYLRGK